MSEKALVVMKDGTEKVLPANNYDTFFMQVTAIPGPYENVKALYVSAELEKVIRKQWANGTAGSIVPLKGLGDLPLEKAAHLFARLESEPCQPLYPSTT